MQLTKATLTISSQASAGLLADGQHIVSRAREEADNYRDNYRSPAPLKVIADRLGLYCQAYTLYSSVRPFGLSTLIGGVDQAYGPSLYCIEPSGIYWVCDVLKCFEASH